MSLPDERSSEIRFAGPGTDGTEYAEAATEQILVQNAEPRKEGGYAKRYGMTVLDSELDSAYGARAILRTRSGAVVMRKRDAVSLRADAIEDDTSSGLRYHNYHANVRTVGFMPLSRPHDTDITSAGRTETDGAVLLGADGRTYTCLVGATNGARISVAVFEDTQLVYASYLATVGRYPRVVAIPGVGFHILYLHATDGDVLAVTLDPAASPVTLTPTTVQADTAVLLGGLFDAAHSADDHLVVVYQVGADLKLLRLNPSTLAVLTSATFTTDAVATNEHLYSVCVTPSGIVHVVDGNNAGGGDYRVFRIDASNTLTHTSTPSGQSSRARLRVGIACTPDHATPQVLVAVETFDAAAIRYVEYANLTHDHGTVSANTEITHAVLYSKPFVDYVPASVGLASPEHVFAAVLGRVSFAGDSGSPGSEELFPTYVARLTAASDPDGSTFANPYAEPIAVLSPQRGGPTMPFSPLPGPLGTVTALRTVSALGQVGTDWYIPALTLTDTIDASTKLHAPRMYKLEHALNDPLPRADFAGMTYQGGSVLKLHNGADLIEASPMPALRVSAVVTGTGNLEAGEYSWVALLVYEDAFGNVRRGTPTFAAGPYTVGASGAASVTVHVRCPSWHTQQDGFGGAYRIELYRTVVNGAEFYLETVHTVVDLDRALTFASAEADSTITDNKLLYTTGGVLANEPAPAASALAVHSGRLFGVDATDRYSVFYTKELEEGFYPEFNAVLRFRAPSPVIGLASMDDKLLLFTEHGVYGVFGAGPNNLGVGAYSPPERVAPGAVATTPYGIAELPFGVMFHSKTGMKVLGRDLTVADARGPIDDYLGPSAIPLQSQHIPALRQVWWLLGGSARDHSGLSRTWLVFDYNRDKGRWIVNDLGGGSGLLFALDVAVVDDVPHILGSTTAAFGSGFDGVVYRDTTTYADFGPSTPLFVPLSVQITNWRPKDGSGSLLDGGLLAEVRVRRAHVLTSGSAGTDSLRLTASKARQPRTHDTDSSEQYTWTAVQYQDSAYGHVTTRLKQQRLNAITLKVATVEGASADSAGPVLHGVVLDWSPTGRTARRGAFYRPT